MTDIERSFYESDGYCTIYRIIKRYYESEYLEEKYGRKKCAVRILAPLYFF